MATSLLPIRNDELPQRLAAYPPQFREFVRKGVFAFDASEARTGALAFYASMTDEACQAYVVTRGRFVMAELSPKGDAIVVTVPLRRILRVEDLTVGGVTTCAVEYEGDRHAVVDVEVTVHRHTYSTYQIKAVSAEEVANLREFSMALRVTLDEIC